MEPHFTLFYLMELSNLIDQSIIAYDLIFDTLKKMNAEIREKKIPRDPDAYWRGRETTWMYVMTFLALSANVSKLLFPSRRDGKRAINRGNTLRSLLEVEDGSLLKKRKLRDHFEHFDARLDDYFQSPRKHTYIDKNIGVINEFKGLNTNEVLRHLDDKNEVVIFLGEEYDIKKIKGELISLNKRVLSRINPRMRRNPNYEE